VLKKKLLGRRDLLILFLVLFILNTADFVLTVYGLNLGVLVEENPIFLYLWKEKSFLEIIIFKYSGLAFLLFLIIFSKKATPIIYRILILLVFFLATVVLSHFYWVIIYLL